MSLSAIIASRHRVAAGITILGETFDDFGNTITPGTGAWTFAVNPPVGTTAIVVQLIAVNRKASGITINGSAITLIADVAQQTGGCNPAIYAMTSGIPTGSVNLVVSWVTGTSRAAHCKVWYIKGGTLTTANWRSSVVFSAATATSNSTSVTPTTTDGMIFAHVACLQPGIAVTLTGSGYTEAAQDATTAGSTSTGSIMSSWGTLANTSTAAKTVSLTTAGTVRNAICELHIPNV